MADSKKYLSDKDINELVEVWKVLEMLTVSFNRIGWYEAFNNEEAGKNAVHAFIKPPVFRKVANARSLMVEFLEKQDALMLEKLEAMAENEEDIGYWQGPTEKLK